MRKVFLFCTLLAGIAMMAGCQKEQGTVTLKAIISQDSKAYIGTDNYPFWDDDDMVNINGTAYQLAEGSVDGTYATISDVPYSRRYCAIFLPGGTVNSMENGTASITLPTVQNPWRLKDGQYHQHLDMPMAAVTEGNTLYFKNLCSVVRVTVNNNTGADFTVNSIILSVDGFNICGQATVDFSQNPATLTMLPVTAEHETEFYHTVIYKVPNAWTVNNISNEQHKDFDIIVPPFTNKNVYIRVETTGNKHYQVKVTGASLGRSKIVPITLNVTTTQLDDDGPAILKPGPQIKEILQHYQATNIVFQYGTPAPTSGVFSRIDLEDGHCTPVYAIVNGNTLNIRTIALDVYANPNSSHMFENMGADLSNGIDQHFKTDYVTDMSYMFANNPNMSSLGNLNTFITTNVTDMSYMFANDEALTQLNFFSDPEPNYTYTFPYPSTNNSRLTNMEGMFSGCTSLSGLNMKYFNTSSVTNMKDLFNGCVAMSFLHINNFVMTNVTEKTDMCTGLGSNHANPNGANVPSTNPCQIYCTSSTQGYMSTNTGLNPYVVQFNTVSK